MSRVFALTSAPWAMSNLTTGKFPVSAAMQRSQTAIGNAVHLGPFCRSNRKYGIAVQTRQDAMAYNRRPPQSGCRCITGPALTNGVPIQNCLQVIDLAFSTCPPVLDKPDMLQIMEISPDS